MSHRCSMLLEIKLVQTPAVKTQVCIDDSVSEEIEKETLKQLVGVISCEGVISFTHKLK